MKPNSALILNLLPEADSFMGMRYRNATSNTVPAFCLLDRENVSAGRNAPSGKFFGWQIFKQDLHFYVKIQVLRGFSARVFAGCLRRAETFLRGF